MCLIMLAVLESGVGFREGCRIVCCIMLAVLERGVGWCLMACLLAAHTTAQCVEFSLPPSY